MEEEPTVVLEGHSRPTCYVGRSRIKSVQSLNLLNLVSLKMHLGWTPTSALAETTMRKLKLLMLTNYQEELSSQIYSPCLALQQTILV
jgi:hypothetical protein